MLSITDLDHRIFIFGFSKIFRLKYYNPGVYDECIGSASARRSVMQLGIDVYVHNDV